MDIYIEHLIKKENSNIYLVAVATVVVGLLLSGLCVLFLGAMALLPIAAIAYGAYYIITSQNVEYEYTLTNSELDVDKITARRKRKRVLSVEYKAFEDLVLQKDYRPGRKVDITMDASTGAGDGYVALFVKENTRYMLVFNPNDAMMEQFKNSLKRKIAGL